MIDTQALLSALGGADNIESLEPCITRLRVEVTDPRQVDRVSLRAVGAHGMSVHGRVIQVVVGPNADVIASEIGDALWQDPRE